MAYTKQTWADNDATKPLSAARLTVIETGIFDAHSGLSTKADVDHNHDTADINSGTFSIDRMPPGTTITVDKALAIFGSAAGVWPTTRPTSRTDIKVVWMGDTDPGAIAQDRDQWLITT